MLYTRPCHGILITLQQSVSPVVVLVFEIAIRAACLLTLLIESQDKSSRARKSISYLVVQVLSLLGILLFRNLLSLAIVVLFVVVHPHGRIFVFSNRNLGTLVGVLFSDRFFLFRHALIDPMLYFLV